jgi:hypothetical protein
LSTLLRSSPRKHEHIAKGYLRGRYGAIPSIQPDIYTLAAKPRAMPARAAAQPNSLPGP